MQQSGQTLSQPVQTATGCRGNQLLHYACRTGAIEIVRWLVQQGVPLNEGRQLTSNGSQVCRWTPLHEACFAIHRHIDMHPTLSKTLNARRRMSFSARERHTRSKRFDLEGSPRTRGHSRSSSLGCMPSLSQHSPAKKSVTACVQVLLEAGVKPMEVDDAFSSALCLAAARPMAHRAVQLLLRCTHYRQRRSQRCCCC